MKTPLEIASHETIAEIRELENHTDKQIAAAASMAILALLAIRDRVKRANHPDVYQGRMKMLADTASRLA